MYRVEKQGNRATLAKSTKFGRDVPWDNTNDLSRSPTKNIHISWNYDVISCQFEEILKYRIKRLKIIDMGII